MPSLTGRASGNPRAFTMNWVIAPDPTMTLADAEERTADLLNDQVPCRNEWRATFLWALF